MMVALAIVVALMVLISVAFGYFLGVTRNRPPQTPDE